MEFSGIDFSYFYILRLINLFVHGFSLWHYKVLFHFKIVVFAFYSSYFFTSFTFDSLIHNDLIFAILFRLGIQHFSNSDQLSQKLNSSSLFGLNYYLSHILRFFVHGLCICHAILFQCHAS